ncbi:signal recognition particle-docking protein FtsY [Mumia sp. zg.B53]|uniref:signal recognition particle-docking protein FtsY n=1 Tax=unclassified Mumia TaxID=2621872 RepID=UPI001C6F5357|nr:MULTISPECIES: signal recognition particle-docking protein FtsY [unclassified Mumia]MBW9205592.1 signal recognition particle-docking protein FtsY [Mumia sp. zg.B17]MBW9208407.1 signal recognition particle-docking protein FtsY [Mumia sp. zg.B21]MBW9216364.1 signal recognition particle-docking protein FtsY [Mumia sp. zg.B53]MDD9348593.1 signal recognition particle-docking protein FtsY [Mumia sp.]
MSDTTTLYVFIGLAVAVLLIGGIAAFVVGSRGKALPPADTVDRRLDDLRERPEQEPAPTGDGVEPVLPEPGEIDESDTGNEPGAVATAPTAPGPAIEEPAPAAGRLVRLRTRLARSQSSLGKSLLALLGRDRLDEDTWEEIEDTLLTADVGVAPTQELVERLRTRIRVEGVADPAVARSILREELVTLVDPSYDRSIAAKGVDGAPGVVLVVGVNGTGKTTTVGRLARVLIADGDSVVLGAADTFRAAAADQLQTWGERVGVPTVRGPEGGDPASVAFDTVKTGKEGGYDTVVIDTAGRLHTKAGLMDELGKVKRVIEKQAPVTEVLLVIDATTGQNGLTQARVFAEVVDVTGIVLTKLDGTAKGGIVIAVQRELGVPVKLVGLGEGADDLAPFVADEFVDALLS